MKKWCGVVLEKYVVLERTGQNVQTKKKNENEFFCVRFAIHHWQAGHHHRMFRDFFQLHPFQYNRQLYLL